MGGACYALLLEVMSYLLLVPYYTVSKYWRSLERVKNVKKKKPNLGALHTLVRVVLTTRLGKKEIGGWGAEGAQTCACAPSADQLGSTSTEEEAHDCHLPSFLDSPLVGLREANIYQYMRGASRLCCALITALAVP